MKKKKSCCSRKLLFLIIYCIFHGSFILGLFSTPSLASPKASEAVVERMSWVGQGSDQETATLLFTLYSEAGHAFVHPTADGDHGAGVFPSVLQPVHVLGP